MHWRHWAYRADVTVNYVAAAQNVASNTTSVSMLLMVSFVVVLIVLVGLISTLVMNILDRTKEIGMLRCIGAKSKDALRRPLDTPVRWEGRSRPHATATTALPRLCPLSTYLCASTMSSRA
jgi:hypothetical protein